MDRIGLGEAIDLVSVLDLDFAYSGKKMLRTSVGSFFERVTRGIVGLSEESRVSVVKNDFG